MLDTAPLAYPLDENEPDLLLVLGDDPNGVPLEIVVRVGDDTVRVLHVMRMRPKYRFLCKLSARGSR